MTTESEEVVGNAGLGDAEHIGPELGDAPLSVGARGDVLRRPRSPGSGSALRSTLPLALSGIAGSGTWCAGTM
ncbi:hypothetical protein OG884_36855 [Streptosporangium sp. NBC_01755]|uniref:hypothetical protein n=1 Tax=unclassified Streptosporangium TaxID=2632669 RepID=UPI002DDA817A|nr:MULTISPECIES: hypothetical protein [unclassified Streptosporangium]WSA29814.1 hypothetical protein OIE13_10480 [Streptosporangium sp. NBC_01810]WSD04301.1 hypothetical protein OG884_36855 [Streptosporangium sp. NBC_01755]